jgi:hypothetical protein
VFEAAICCPSDHIGDAQTLWLGIAEQAARCLAEHVRGGGSESLAGAAGVAEAIRRSVMKLDEADADIVLQLMYEARRAPLGEPVKVNRAAFLRAMGRSTGKHDYEWLHRRLKSLMMSTLIIEARRPDGSRKYRIGQSEAFHILQGFGYDEETEVYTFTLDPRWRTLFGGSEYSLIDWDKRMEMGQDMAKALQRLVATSADPIQRYALDYLKDKMQYASPMRKFKGALVAAMRELERLGIIEKGHIDESTRGKPQAVWTRL